MAIEETRWCICTQSHSIFEAGKVYKYEYSDYTASGGSIWRNVQHPDKANCIGKFESYAKKDDKTCNLDYFSRIYFVHEVNYFVKSRFREIINNIFHKNINIYKNKPRKYDFTELQDNLAGKVSLYICYKIYEIYDSEYYLYHQEKIHHILNSISELSKFQNVIDLEFRIDKYIHLIDIIVASINLQESNIDTMGRKLNSAMVATFIEKEDKLLDEWETGIKEMWNGEVIK